MTDSSRPTSSRITITEASRLFGVSTNTIRRRVKKGHLTPFQRHQPGGRPRYLFDVSDLVRVFGEPSRQNPYESHGDDSDMPRNVPNEESIETKEIFERLNSFHRLEKEYDALKARFEAQSRHLEDLQRLLTPRLKAPRPIGQRRALVSHRARHRCSEKLAKHGCTQRAQSALRHFLPLRAGDTSFSETGGPRFRPQHL